ncbi:MAG: endonuclease/exonuclease/phosphatase family protein [Rothia sp. (in: high G+C Gram-positive bacteria)]|nr:endonuclease/exonuclease/phosphatase family protein [Rothia sp. (in: high G+C Gram-positive bacteria)]
MKLLTLNAHSWVELFQVEKIRILADFMIEQQVDAVFLQEVCQHQGTRLAEADSFYLPAVSRRPHLDNFAQLLSHFLQDAGTPYYWSWADSHQGWGAYDEGVALLTRTKPKQVHSLVMDDSYSYDQVWRRAAIAAELDVAGKSLWVCSTHMNWWFKEGLHLFEKDFTSLDAQLRQLAGTSPILLGGDFNNDPDDRGEGYDQVLALGWKDTFSSAQKAEGEYTVHKQISGWSQATKAMRIDFFFSSIPLAVTKHQVVFADNSDQAISDHSGVLIEFDPAQLF